MAVVELEPLVLSWIKVIDRSGMRKADDPCDSTLAMQVIDFLESMGLFS